MEPVNLTDLGIEELQLFQFGSAFNGAGKQVLPQLFDRIVIKPKVNKFQCIGAGIIVSVAIRRRGNNAFQNVIWKPGQFEQNAVLFVGDLCFFVRLAGMVSRLSRIFERTVLADNGFLPLAARSSLA